MIHLDSISLAFGGQQIFNELSWFIGETGRTGLVGPNGAGKTTLLRLLSGSLTPDSGTLKIRGGTSIGYLEQEVLEESAPDETVVEHVLASFGNLADLETAEQKVLRRLEEPDLSDDRTGRLLHRLEEIHAKMEAMEAHRLEYRAESVLVGLGFEADDMDRDVRSFSGGWRMRMALATLLLQSPELLLLDEPTNHLDIETIDWLEEYLKDYDGAVILVSHDRYFLDRMVTSIAELSRGRITDYTGNYEAYLSERALRMEQQRAAYENQQREIRQAERFIERFRAKATKAAQAQSRIKMLERMERIDEPVEDETAIRFQFPEGTKPYRVVLELTQFSKAYDLDDGQRIQVFDKARPLKVERGDRIALVGKNGAGKSTLARILKGIEPFDGERTLGGRVEVGFFAQNQAESLDPSQTVLSSMQQAAYGWTETQTRSLLGAFLFSGDDVDKPTTVLSGGERNRLALAITLVTPANFLILDEPTNHLDIRSRNALVQALRQFPGTFVVISHDRHFVDHVADKVWYVADGDVREYLGTYSEMRQVAEGRKSEVRGRKSEVGGRKSEVRGRKSEVGGRRSEARGHQTRGDNGVDDASSSQNSSGASGPKSKEQKRREAEERNRLSKARKMVKELIDSPESTGWSKLPAELLPEAIRLLESSIDTLEREKAELEAALADPEFYSDADRSSTAVARFEQVERDIKASMDRWEELAAAREG